MPGKRTSRVQGSLAFKSPSRSSSRRCRKPELHPRIKCDNLAYELKPDAVEVANKVVREITSVEGEDPALMFVEGDEAAIHAALGVACGPVPRGITPAASRANLRAFLDAAAAEAGNFADNQTRGLNSIAYHHLTMPQMLAILNQWRRPVWIAKLREARKKEYVGELGKVLVFFGSGSDVDVVEEKNVFG